MVSIHSSYIFQSFWDFQIHCYMLTQSLNPQTQIVSANRQTLNSHFASPGVKIPYAITSTTIVKTKLPFQSKQNELKNDPTLKALVELTAKYAVFYRFFCICPHALAAISINWICYSSIGEFTRFAKQIYVFLLH